LYYLLNYWLKKQLTYFVRLNRGRAYCPIRNQLQDLLGFSLLNPEDAFAYSFNIIQLQKLDGYIKQYYTTDGSPATELALLNHSDSYLWFVLCLVEVIENSGHPEWYDKKLPYSDSPLEETVLVHLKKAVHYMLTQTGEHGLCLMFDGDWNEPVNGPGHLGKGESTWNSMALAYAIDALNRVDFDASLDAKNTELKNNINKHCWDGEWYLAGINDDGIPYGSHKDEEAKKFLNTQTWAIISGVATGQRLEKTVKTIETLRHKCGYVLIDPPFTKYNPIWGRVSLKTPGTTENGSVYNHAVNAKQRDRFRAVVLALEGKMEPEIRRMLHRSRGFIQRWVYAYRDRGISGLFPQSPPGKPSKLTNLQREQLKASLEGRPFR
jgi:cellobiose phosphorylase